MLPEPSPVGGGGGEIELCPSAREALPPGGTSLNLSERHARARPHDGGRGGARGGPPTVMNRAGRSPNPNPSYTGTSYGHVPGVGLFRGACTAVGRAAALSRKGTLLKNSRA